MSEETLRNPMVEGNDDSGAENFLISVIIFDFGGVILKHRTDLIERILSQMVPDDLDAAKKVWSEYRLLLNTGKKTSHDFIFELKNRISTPLSLDQLKYLWSGLYKKETEGVDWELVQYIQKLKEKYRIYLFTDTIDVHDEYNSTRGIYDHFHGVYKSFEEGVAKLEGQIAFKHLLESIEALPSQCIFIDDLEKNVQNASELEMKYVLYRNFEDLKSQLALAGVTVQDR